MGPLQRPPHPAAVLLLLAGEQILELSTSLREVAQYPEKGPTIWVQRSFDFGEGLSTGLLRALRNFVKVC